MTDRAIVVTGASTGIGRECVRLLAAEGYRVFAGVRTSQDAQALLQEVPRGLTPVFLDVTDAASIRAAFQTVSQELKDGLFGLVNNAGITVAGPLEVLPIDALRRQIEVNVIGTVAVTQAFLPLLRKAGGRIVLMGSILGRVALPFVGAYSISKFALEAVTDSMGMELAGSGVSVSLMEPGNIATPIWAKSKQGFLDTTNDAPGMALYRA
ncbi:MAG TPA: SDR family NAD(P)-dependent oxidoreductase, partial [Spirochaetia bacterium]|nr:SDR family NAD(P)-dependent oxidoreductase [Spirochaetia bacterium]